MRTTTSHTKKGVPLRLFSSQFLWDLSAGDVVIAIPPRGPYFFIVTTSLATLTKYIAKLGGPAAVSALSSRVSKKMRTYTLSLERRHLNTENRILKTANGKARQRVHWTDDEWIMYFKGVGRSRGAYKIFLTTKYRQLKNLSKAQKLYWELINKTGLK